ncbi:hypothetical protein IU429_02680 [Nocardia elegans]|uniref:Uncharacterized protein n=1 Tax=Nocardia elegans TaxID=300029 RepID=A0ABW6TE14_9NOCA|nr:hypothetical protein [Nocardia elegans]MBF6446567.1 hypothetical protein [Nocardia elegans]
MATAGFANHASWIAIGLVVAVVMHAALTFLWKWLNPYKSLAVDTNTGTAVTLYLGAAAAAAIVAGFAGVVIVFAIGSTSRRVRIFRFRAGEALQGAWIAVVAEPFAATLLGFIAAIVQLTSGRQIAPWFFELALALLAHGGVLLLWILNHLMEIVYADDVEADSKDREISTDSLFPPLPRNKDV